MSKPVQIVDLFSGPGGLGEGFSSCRGSDGSRAYEIAVSIEKDRAAHKTLRLRAFLRQFDEYLRTTIHGLPGSTNARIGKSCTLGNGKLPKTRRYAQSSENRRLLPYFPRGFLRQSDWPVIALS